MGREDMTSSHSEKQIYEGCISLMNQLFGQIKEWLHDMEYISEDDDPEELFSTGFYNTEIVERLFLWNTTHSGGTSQRLKCKELGIDPSESIYFSLALDQDDEDKDTEGEEDE